jgi:hypothetical protein
MESQRLSISVIQRVIGEEVTPPIIDTGSRQLRGLVIQGVTVDNLRVDT